MGRLANKLSLMRRADNRTAQRPPSVDDQTLSPHQQQQLSSGDEHQRESNDRERRRSRRERAADERRAQEDDGQCLWSNLGGKMSVPADVADDGHKMNTTTILKILLSIRAASSFWSIILDCDEVYNYWEPLHLLLFGHGMQTWEYSPEYGIRSWAYVYVHYAIGYILRPMTWGSKATLFYLIRFSIALVTMAAEYCAYESACARLGNTVGSFYIVVSMFSVGVFNAGCAFLPSSFGMIMNTFAMAAYLRERWLLAIGCTAVGALLGWPFCAVLGLPIVVEMLVVRRQRLGTRFVAYAASCGVAVLMAMTLLDSHFYGRLVVAPLNIVLYNVFSTHGSSLYGTEGVGYYVKNLVLNWNLSLIPAAFSALMALIVFVRTHPHTNRLVAAAAAKEKTLPSIPRPLWTVRYWYRFVPVALMFVSCCIWLAIFFSQAHKEERFLFPAFSLIALLAAIGLHALLHVAPWPRTTTTAFVFVFVLMSLSRGYALHRNYSASTETYKSFHDHFLLNSGSLNMSTMHNPVRLCVGKEWHRFPSSFFVPEHAVGSGGERRRVEMRFLRSEFRGILPKPFGGANEGDDVTVATRNVPTEMNDANREETSRYVPLHSCDFLVDLDTSRYTTDEPDYARRAQFKTLSEKPFLLAAESHWLFRAFYVPFTEQRLRYGLYQLLQRVAPD